MCLSLKSDVFSSEYMNYNKILLKKTTKTLKRLRFIKNPKQSSAQIFKPRLAEIPRHYWYSHDDCNEYGCYNAYDDVDNNNYNNKKNNDNNNRNNNDSNR